MHPLLKLAASRPQLVFDHATAYADLAGAELEGMGSRLQRQALWGVAGLCLLSLAIGLAGVSCLLWATVPMAAMPAPWGLWLVPLTPALGALVCLLARHRAEAVQPFARLRLQLHTDLALWHELAAK